MLGNEDLILESIDPAILESLHYSHGCETSLDPDGLAKFTYLQIDHARSLRGIQLFAGLEILVLVGCDSISLDPILELKSVESLKVRVSGLREIPNFDATSLFLLELRNNFISDVSPLIDCYKLNYVDVTGNPLSEESYYDVLPQLRRRGVRITVSGEREWRLTVRLHANGMPYSYYFDGSEYRLCRPGLKHTDRPELNHPAIPPAYLDELLDDDPTMLHDLFSVSP